MFMNLSHLHNANDCGLYEEFAIFLNHLVCLFLLLFDFRFEGNVNIDAELLVLVLLEEGDDAAFCEVIFTLARREEKELDLEQNLEHLDENVHLEAGRVRQLGHAVRVVRVEHEEDGHLKSGGLEDVLVLETVRRYVPFRSVIEPGQLPARVFTIVKFVKFVNALFQLEEKL